MDQEIAAQVRELVPLLGGAANVSTVSHCLTRLRLELADLSLADRAVIELLPSVKGICVAGGQFQIVIGSSVEEFHRELTALLDAPRAGSSVPDVSASDASGAGDAGGGDTGGGEPAGFEGGRGAGRRYGGPFRNGWCQRAVAHLGQIFVPLLSALIAGGLVLCARTLIGDIPLMHGETLAETSQFWAGAHQFLWLIGEAIFHFLPVGVCWATVKKLGGTEVLGIVLGITLVSPQLMNAYAATEKPGAWDFGFAQMPMAGYQGQVVPAALAGVALVMAERHLKRVVPRSLHQAVVPFLALTVSVVLAHACIGPLGRAIGDVVGAAAKAMLTGTFGPAGAVLFGVLYAPLVITGLHHATIAVDLQLMQELGGTPIWPLIALSNIAQASAVVGVIVVSRRGPTRDLAVPAAISAYLGVTEPAMYGVNLRLRYPLLAAMAGSGSAALICGTAGTMAHGIGVGGLPGILSVQPAYWGVFALAMAFAVVVPLALTLAFAQRLGAQDALADSGKVQA